MAEGRTIPVRLAPEVIRRLDAVAKRTGMSRNALMKFCVSTFACEMENADLTADTLRAWTEVLRELDGRTQRYRAAGREPELKVAETGGRYPRKRKKKTAGRGKKGSDPE